MSAVCSLLSGPGDDVKAASPGMDAAIGACGSESVLQNASPPRIPGATCDAGHKFRCDIIPVRPERCPRGRRGRPAKALCGLKPASRVRIPLSPPPIPPAIPDPHDAASHYGRGTLLERLNAALE